ncbi:MAG: hypothetical protein HYT15_02985 [Candidatus Magasanikbacteria bacterium]|nr:hypothetical protein [Candidatus Magasanikbacteria bacterium]
MKSKLVLMCAVVVMLVTGAGCASLKDSAPVTDISPVQEYAIKEWKKLDVKDVNISVPSDFQIIPPGKENPWQYTFWPVDQNSAFLVEFVTSSRICTKKDTFCRSEAELSRLNAQELYETWKNSKIRGSEIKIVDIEGREAFITTVTDSKNNLSLITLNFVYKNFYYTLSQSNANKYISDGEPIVLKIFKTVHFK